jgi:hypothetical protein
MAFSPRLADSVHLVSLGTDIKRGPREEKGGQEPPKGEIAPVRPEKPIALGHVDPDAHEADQDEPSGGVGEDGANEPDKIDEVCGQGPKGLAAEVGKARQTKELLQAS